MWRMMGLVLGLSALVVMVSTHTPVQAGQDKFLICHVTDDNGAHIIEVAEPALPAHLENHGDCLINSTDRTLIGDDCDATDANLNDICDIQP
jgi:hypothetical protein